MNLSHRFENVFRRLLPAPFTIAVLLSFITLLLAIVFSGHSPGKVLVFWYEGLWEPSLLAFMVQMMLILILGHILALSPVFLKMSKRLCSLAQTPFQAAWLVCFTTMSVAFFNWGLGLIFGAILARNMGAHFYHRGSPLNYPLIAAAGYSGLMVWHGGLSGSAPAKVAEKGHLQQMMSGISDFPQNTLPSQLTFAETVFGNMNLFATLCLLIVLPLGMAWLAARTSRQPCAVGRWEMPESPPLNKSMGAEKLDHSPGLSKIFAGFIILLCLYIAFNANGGLAFLDLNFINLSLLGMGLAFHRNFHQFLHALEQAIGGASGILIQFPLYFGIIGVMKNAGMIEQLNSLLLPIYTPLNFPIFTFFSAGLVNIFIPSGGGQWSIQGPLLIQAAQSLGVDLSKSVMALAYGDQLTNMLQPFWALPLLAITGLKAREILPYSLALLFMGLLIFLTSLIFF